ncbi:hypothetical protein AX16_002078 [Volvariella volvacea WC 439]|nr:hypothetical protein AX16_002078 [Volvariella volvacea WC 439]
MRKISYVLTFLGVGLTLLFNVLSERREDWLVVRYPEVLNTIVTVYYGLHRRCEWTVTRIPNPSGGNGKFEYTDYTCREFPAPVSDGCDKENKVFCASWHTAEYLNQLAIGSGVLALLSILFGVSTHSRRRRIWKAVAGFVFLHAVLQITTFGIVTDLYSQAKFPTFERARPGVAYVVNVLSWVFALLLSAAVLTTGLAAGRGHRWAAGNRAYQPIAG